MKTLQHNSISQKLPLDALVHDFINYLIYENESVSLIYSSNPLGLNYKKALSVILYDNTIGLTMTDIANYTGTTNRSILDGYITNHDYRMSVYDGKIGDSPSEVQRKRNMYSKSYQDIYLDMLILLDKYRQIKNEIYLGGENGASYAKYGDEPLATCSRTGKPILLGDFVASSTQGNSQFNTLPLIEIENNVVGVHNHLIRVPLYPAKGFDDIINWEKIYLTKKSPLAWRVIL